MLHCLQTSLFYVIAILVILLFIYRTKFQKVYYGNTNQNNVIQVSQKNNYFTIIVFLLSLALLEKCMISNMSEIFFAVTFIKYFLKS